MSKVSKVGKVGKVGTGAVELYLIRHGIAVDTAPDGRDESRALTEEGIENLRREAEGLLALGVSWDLVLTSGLVRARETAQVLVRHMRLEAPIVRTAALEPSGSPQSVLTELTKHRHAPSIALVGHEPGMGELAARLLRARDPIPFKKGGVCRIDLLDQPPNDAGVLRWLAPPRMLRGLRR
ncbi:MAG: phosphohistidine phosphatase SixA [Bacteroidota bacterium]